MEPEQHMSSRSSCDAEHFEQNHIARGRPWLGPRLSAPWARLLVVVSLCQSDNSGYAVMVTDMQDFVERTQIRRLLKGIMNGVCMDKPDQLTPYIIDWLRIHEAPDASKALLGQSGQLDTMGTWTARRVAPTKSALRLYLSDIQVAAHLEIVLEAALLEKPSNLPAFIIQRLCQSEKPMAHFTTNTYDVNYGVAEVTEVS